MLLGLREDRRALKYPSGRPAANRPTGGNFVCKTPVFDAGSFQLPAQFSMQTDAFNSRLLPVISQEFHNRRAIYISKTLNMNAIGFNAKDVDLYNGFKTKLREKFSRVNVFIDILIGKKPKFLGEKIEIQ